MKLLDVECIYDPGCHCAFTDIIFWRGRVYVVFREAMNHSVHYSGQIVVLGSADHGKSFQVHARLAQNGFDLRDPHFFICGDRLGLAIPSWIVPDEVKGIPKRIRTCHIALSDNGINWDIQKIDEPKGSTLWRPETGPDGSLYTVAYAPSKEEADYRTALYRSDNGLVWEKVSDIHAEDKANETDICFLNNGELLALVRCEEHPRKPMLAKSKAPYTEWDKVRCSRFLQGPLLVQLPDGTLMAVGRSPEPMDSEKGKGGCVTRVFRLDASTGELEYWFTLPSGGDTSYAGFCELGNGTGLLSYYSGHGYDNGTYTDGNNLQRTGIYLAQLILD